MIKSLLKQSLSKSSKSESTNKIEYNDGSAKIINWEDIYVDIWEAGRLTLTHYKRMTGIFITHDKLRLIKLHPRTNDSSGLYKKYFCLQYSNCLSIGSIRNNKLDVKNITHPLFGHIHRFCLREDNILMLVILKCYRVGYHQQLIFVDCNKIKLIGSIDLDKNIAPPTTPAHIFTELTSTRKDYLLLQSKFTPSITPFLLPPLASIVFSYLFADIPQ
ncbi:MAG: hypothetical protein Hyperionvirus27_4 [Hyperionvirus sp.]|uniref:Uncharacterized protein n=1 Tax=Hyperionvirus sp. TaxID=2487770 RepID=A0A3G5AD00_9VIRU|nr:MAG: hypothetical protein Hyperionvirus27_4 [Hyperionvirus sp.]